MMFLRRPRNIGVLILLCVSGRRAVCCHTSIKILLLFYFLPKLQAAQSSPPAHAQHGLERKPPMDYPLCALRRGWWRGERTCFHRDILTKTGTEREQRSGFAAPLCLALHLYCFWFFYLFFICLYFPASVGDREMFAELLCSAVALVLYVNTLGADFCYDDRYLSEWMTSSPMLLLSLSPRHLPIYTLRVLYKGILTCSLSLCCHNFQWTATATVCL